MANNPKKISSWRDHVPVFLKLCVVPVLVTIVVATVDVFDQDDWPWYYFAALIFFSVVSMLIGSLFVEKVVEIPVGHKAVLVIHGQRRHEPVLEEGQYLLSPGSQLIVFDCREQCHELPQSEALSSDNIPIRYKMSIHLQVCDPFARSEIEEFKESIADHLASAARTEFSKRTALEVASNSDTFAAGIVERFEKTAARWGVEVLDVILSELRLPTEVEKFAQVLRLIRQQHPDLSPKVIIDAIQSNEGSVRKLIMESDTLETVARVISQSIKRSYQI